MNPARRLDASGSAFDRACDGWTMHRLTVIRPATATDPGLYDAAVFPASSVRRDAYDDWLSHVWTAAACSRPVLLRGSVRYIDPATGEVTGTIGTDDLPDQAIYKPCGNRRATTCPGCAETYRRDAFHLLRAGLAGGKGIPDTVAAHPVVFATFTAPSFGPVHSRPVRLHTCADQAHCRCKPEPCHPRRDAGTCPHGRPLACLPGTHRDDPRLGEPLCPDCYDYPAHVVWNAAAGELWRRTKQDIERHLISLAWHRHASGEIDLPLLAENRSPCACPTARPPSTRHAARSTSTPCSASTATDCEDPDAIVAPPPGITAADLEDAVRQAAASICFRTRPHPDSPDGEGWLIAWGDQLDVRPVADATPPPSPAWPSPATSPSTPPKAPRPPATPPPASPPTPSACTRTQPEPTPNGSSTPAGTSATPRGGCAAKPLTAPCAGGRTCSASAATSSPKPAATPSPSPPSARPASPTAAHHDTGPDYTPFDRQEQADDETIAIIVTPVLRRYRLAHLRRRPPRQHRRRPSPQTPPHRTRGNCR